MIKQKDSIYGEAIKFYCKDCQKIVGAKQVGRKNVFRCDICKTKNVAFGTEKSIKNFFHIDDEEESVTKGAPEEKKTENVPENVSEEAQKE